MSALITVLIVLASIALTLVVLVQKSKGGGLASGFSSSNQIMGVRKTTDFIEKATWGLMGIITVLCLLSAVMIKSSQATGPKSEIQAPVLPTTTSTPDVSTTMPIPSGMPQGQSEAPQQ